MRLFDLCGPCRFLAGALDGFCDLADLPYFFSWAFISLHTFHIAALCNMIPGERYYSADTCKAPGKIGFCSILRPPRSIIFPSPIKYPVILCFIMRGELQPSLYLLLMLSSRNSQE